MGRDYLLEAMEIAHGKSTIPLEQAHVEALANAYHLLSMRMEALDRRILRLQFGDKRQKRGA